MSPLFKWRVYWTDKATGKQEYWPYVHLDDAEKCQEAIIANGQSSWILPN